MNMKYFMRQLHGVMKFDAMNEFAMKDDGTVAAMDVDTVACYYGC